MQVLAGDFLGIETGDTNSKPEKVENGLEEALKDVSAISPEKSARQEITDTERKVLQRLIPASEAWDSVKAEQSMLRPLNESHELNQGFMMSGSVGPSQRSPADQSMLASLRSELFRESDQVITGDEENRERESLSKLAVQGSEPPAMLSAVKLPKSPKKSAVETNSSIMRL